MTEQALIIWHLVDKYRVFEEKIDIIFQSNNFATSYLNDFKFAHFV